MNIYLVFAYQEGYPAAPVCYFRFAKVIETTMERYISGEYEKETRQWYHNNGARAGVLVIEKPADLSFMEKFKNDY
jgi:hypothetical protein